MTEVSRRVQGGCPECGSDLLVDVIDRVERCASLDCLYRRPKMGTARALVASAPSPGGPGVSVSALAADLGISVSSVEGRAHRRGVRIGEVGVGFVSMEGAALIRAVERRPPRAKVAEVSSVGVVDRRSMVLRGGVSVELVVSGSVLRLGPSERAFLFDLIDRMASFEAAAP